MFHRMRRGVPLGNAMAETEAGDDAMEGRREGKTTGVIEGVAGWGVLQAARMALKNKNQKRFINCSMICIARCPLSKRWFAAGR